MEGAPSLDRENILEALILQLRPQPGLLLTGPAASCFPTSDLCVPESRGGQSGWAAPLPVGTQQLRLLCVFLGHVGLALVLRDFC